MKGNENLDAGDSADAPLQCQTNPPHRILVVDDDPSICSLSAEVLIRHGYEVEAAADGEAAWEALNTDGYDLLITDNDMPRLTGVELVKKLRAARMDLPVIMATGTLPKEEFTGRPWLQPAAMLLKPFTIDELLGTVRKVLHVTDSVHGQIESPPSQRNWPPTGDWQL